MPTRFDTVIFDVDGTLVDSERDGHRVAFNEAFEAAGLPDRWDVETYGRLLAVTGGAHRMAAWFEENGRPADEAKQMGAELHVAKTAIMRDMVIEGRISARPGARELIDSLTGRGIPIHVATTGTRAWVEPLLSGLFGDVFGEVVTRDEIPDLKPNPAAYLEVLRRIDVDASRAVAVEDSDNGLRAALAANLTCVMATNDYTRNHPTTGATLVATGLNDPALVEWFAG